MPNENVINGYFPGNFWKQLNGQECIPKGLFVVVTKTIPIGYQQYGILQVEMLSSDIHFGGKARFKEQIGSDNLFR